MEPVIYSADIRHIAPRAEVLSAELEAFFPERARKLRAHRNEAARLRGLASGLLLKTLLEERGLPASVIVYGEFGKPSVKGDGGPCFSISHSGNYALLAADDSPVGIDIEKWTARNYAELARTAFHRDEAALVERNPSAKVFFDIWTLKESYIKMLGKGLAEDMTGFCVSPGGKTAVLNREPSLCFRLYDCFEGYSAALCSSRSAWPDEITGLF
jgi:4'-phosphopantetheinyl transferase